MYNDITKELSTNFIEYAVAVNTDRSIPNATDGLKPVAKRIVYGAYDCGFKYEKPHVKCANIVGNVMADWHPHGDVSIYGALVRLSQPWVMRYPLIDFHGSNGNIDGDGPAAYRYTESRLAKLTEDGMLQGIKKKNVDFIPNYSETKEEPVELPAIFPNLLCNPNSGIGVAIASSWACHNLCEVAQAIYDQMDGKEPMLPGPDFPTGGVIINKDIIPSIMRTGHGSVKIRGKYNIDGNNIVFTEIPYGVGTESLMQQIGEACDSGEITGVSDIRNESNKKGFRLVIECEKNAPIATILNKLFAKTDLQSSFSYNQVALVDKTPTELNLKDCIKIYIDYNSKCIVREVLFDIKKAEDRLHIISGLLKALNSIDEIIATIKASDSVGAAKEALMTKWDFSEVQAKAILDMKLSKLAKLEKAELEKEQEELQALLIKLQEIHDNPVPELRKRLEAIVAKYGDARRTELTQIAETKEEKEIENVPPEEVVVVVTESGCVKRVPKTSFKAQKRGGKGIKTQDDVTKWVFKTNTVDTLMVFTSSGQMYRLLVNDIPVGTNTTKGSPISSLIEMAAGEQIMAVTSLFRNTDAKYVLFATKGGIVKKSSLEDYSKTKKKNGIKAITLREGDSLAAVTFLNEEDIVLLTRNGMCIRVASTDFGVSSRIAQGVIGIGLKGDDQVIALLPIKHSDDQLAIFTQQGLGKKTPLSDYPKQQRAGKGLACIKFANDTDALAGGLILSDDDLVLVCGKTKSLCVQSSDLSSQGRATIGTKVISNNNVVSVSKV